MFIPETVGDASFLPGKTIFKVGAVFPAVNMLSWEICSAHYKNIQRNAKLFILIYAYKYFKHIFVHFIQFAVMTEYFINSKAKQQQINVLPIYVPN